MSNCEAAIVCSYPEIMNSIYILMGYLPRSSILLKVCLLEDRTIKFDRQRATKDYS